LAEAILERGSGRFRLTQRVASPILSEEGAALAGGEPAVERPQGGRSLGTICHAQLARITLNIPLRSRASATPAAGLWRRASASAAR
jgi:hypothetical protein